VAGKESRHSGPKTRPLAVNPPFSTTGQFAYGRRSRAFGSPPGLARARRLSARPHLRGLEGPYLGAAPRARRAQAIWPEVTVIPWAASVTSRLLAGGAPLRWFTVGLKHDEIHVTGMPPYRANGSASHSNTPEMPKIRRGMDGRRAHDRVTLDQVDRIVL
jgi:hypothetical protein